MQKNNNIINIPNICATTLRKKEEDCSKVVLQLCAAQQKQYTKKTPSSEKKFIAPSSGHYVFPSCTAAPAPRRPRRAGGTAATARLRAVEELRAVGEALYLIFVLFVARRGGPGKR